MKTKIKLSDGATAPVNANQTDTGYDITAISEPKIVGTLANKTEYSSIDYIEYETGIALSPINEGSNILGQLCGDKVSGKINFTFAYPRSSISKYNLVLANSVGIIDNGYINTIKYRFKYIIQPEDLRISNHNCPTEYNSIITVKINMDKIYKKGDKIGQLVGATKEDIQFFAVDYLELTDRGTGGFGSTGR